jgi:hypothetical protein
VCIQKKSIFISLIELTTHQFNLNSFLAIDRQRTLFP